MYELAELTILIPTFNRPLHLERNLSFLQMQGLRSEVIVLDGSSDNSKKQHNKIICESSKLNLKYINYDPALNLGLRIKDGFNQVQTTFSIILPDDDFILISGIKKCLQFLQDNSDYTSVTGRVLCLYNRGGWPIPLFCFSKDLSTPYSQNSSEILKRIVMHDCMTLVGYPPLYYGVKRTELFRDIYSHLHQDFKYSSMEKLSNLLTLIRGKHKVLTAISHLRDYDTPAIRDELREGLISYIPQADQILIEDVCGSELQNILGTESKNLLSQIVQQGLKVEDKELTENLLALNTFKGLKKSNRVLQYLFYGFLFPFINDSNGLSKDIIRNLRKALRRFNKQHNR